MAFSSLSNPRTWLKQNLCLFLSSKNCLQAPSLSLLSLCHHNHHANHHKHHHTPGYHLNSSWRTLQRPWDGRCYSYLQWYQASTRLQTSSLSLIVAHTRSQKTLLNRELCAKYTDYNRYGHKILQSNPYYKYTRLGCAIPDEKGEVFKTCIIARKVCHNFQHEYAEVEFVHAVSAGGSVKFLPAV